MLPKRSCPARYLDSEGKWLLVGAIQWPTSEGDPEVSRTILAAEDFAWCHLAEGLSRAGFELANNVVVLVPGVEGQVGALRKVLAQEAVGVLAGCALPRASGIAEVDGTAGVDDRADVLGHLLALVPGEGASELIGQCGQRFSEGVPSIGSTAAGREVQEEHKVTVPCDDHTAG